ncbi:MAG: ModD protein, partial [Coriobacteriia bacterium]|nr:ModD protein [Coriobacteriia bacterium]
MYISDARLDQIILEDVPYCDLTTDFLDIAGEAGEIEFYTREDAILCCVEEAIRIMEKLDLELVDSIPSGTKVSAGSTFLRAQGKAGNLMLAWKVVLNLFEHYCGVATKTHNFVQKVQAVNPYCQVLATRKTSPGNKEFLIKAIMTGGAVPHRLGLSETILVFDWHRMFMGGFDEFLEKVPELLAKSVEKRVLVEAEIDEALQLVEVGVDAIQLDKVTPENVKTYVEKLRSINPDVTILAAGGINEKNCEAYAASGANGLVTSALYKT